MDFLAPLDGNTRRLVALGRAADLTEPVPTCGAWTFADLVWHVCEVQDFWAWVVETRATQPDDYPEPTRPDDSGLVDRLDAARERLVALLRDTDPASPCWSWGTEQTAGFTMRRQAHEALIHRVDAELALGQLTPIDAGLAADGVDELLTVFLGDLPPWAAFAATDDAIELATTDAPRSWTMRFGQLSGTSPTSGRTYDVPALLGDEEARPGARVHAGASALDCWLWGRHPDDAVDIEGDHSVVERLRAIIIDATQ